MIAKNQVIILLLILVSIFSSCQKHETCSSVISVLVKSGCTAKDLSKILDVPEKIIRNPDKYNFSVSDSILLFSLLNTYKETGKLPDNLYQLYNKNSNNQIRLVINNYREEELKSNKIFIDDLCQQIIDKQNENLNDFVEGEINSIKSLRFSWKSQDEINEELRASLPKYINELEVSKTFNDSCASYINYISHYRENGVKRYIKKNIPKQDLNTIDTDIRGFVPEYKFENSSANITYQLLATIDRAQDIIFTPINWLLGLLPQWLTLTISIILLIILIICFITGQIQVGIIDFILLIISAIVFIWGDPYSEIRESMNDQIKAYYEPQINNELAHLNDETNKYYDNLIESVSKTRNHNSSARKLHGLQTSIKTNNKGADGANYERVNKEDSERSDENGSKIDIEAIRENGNETTVANGD